MRKNETHEKIWCNKRQKKITGLDTKISLVIGLDLKVSPVNAYT